MKLTHLKVFLDNGESIIIPMERVDEYSYTNVRHISLMDNMHERGRKQLYEMYDENTLICDTLILKVNYNDKDNINNKLANDDDFLGYYREEDEPNNTLNTKPHILGRLLSPQISCVQEININNKTRKVHIHSNESKNHLSTMIEAYTTNSQLIIHADKNMNNHQNISDIS